MTRGLLAFALAAAAGLASGQQTGGTGAYPAKYNLIDPDPSCRYASTVWTDKGPQCPIYSGAADVDVMAAHPNVMERTLYLMRNMARLFPTFYAASEWGWSSATYKDDCHQSHSPERPYYFMSEAVQAARLNAFSGATTYSGCSRSACGSASSHFTCCDYCGFNIWAQCGFKYRTRGIVQPLFAKNAWNDVGSEGIWGQNTAFISSAAHCGQNFNPAYDHQGIGFYPGGATTMVGIKDTGDWEDHVFPHATHFDWDSSDHFTFLVQWFGKKQTVPRRVVQLFLLYGGEATDMGSPIAGDDASGFFVKQKPLTATCEPYAFMAQDQIGEWHRLPEEKEYYFGTVSQPQSLLGGSAACAENHYYFDGSEWSANGGPGLANNKTEAGGCAGCSKARLLNELVADLQAGSRGSDANVSRSRSGGVSFWLLLSALLLFGVLGSC
ncbi:hypothetical protein AK812_SmicGene19460 [Symbiodinium microadriaticum]|uniref:Uncharacterized protein n=1 Tax=Symbiodinium microadriaticum TaxID=2951 RepID=A0A1Q9DSL6_SYMMI|nr:hypothetical protein AK812_SmicGene19460 [Symbiodinium microadriaticum]